MSEYYPSPIDMQRRDIKPHVVRQPFIEDLHCYGYTLPFPAKYFAKASLTKLDVVADDHVKRCDNKIVWDKAQ